MHPELLENPQFLRHYQKWQQDPKSMAFIPVAEYFLKYNLLNEAFQVCREGVNNHPSLISARILLAKILFGLKRNNEAIDELKHVLNVVPEQPAANELLSKIQNEVAQTTVVFNFNETSPWCNVTMAKIHARQGNTEEAKKIYQTILQKDPNNLAARDGLNSLGVI